MPERAKVTVKVMVKICGLVRAEDARHVADAGADLLGAILSPGFPRSVAPEHAREFTDPNGPPLVAVLVNEPPARAAALGRTAGAAVLQLHGDESPDTLEVLRDTGSWSLWKALRPRTPDDLRRDVERYAEHVDGFLLDGWHATERGGAGVCVAPELVAAARDGLPGGVLLALAGGLTPESVAEAVARAQPDLVDVSSGVEAALGRKDPVKVERFLRAARAGTSTPEVR